MVFFQENTGVRQPKLVDGLLHVSHQETVLLFLRQGGENRVLNTVGILVFVHQNFPVTAADLPGSGSGTCTAPSQQQVQGFMLQIPKIQTPAAALGGGIVPSELPNQGHQSPGARGRLGQIHKHLG